MAVFYWTELFNKLLNNLWNNSFKDMHSVYDLSFTSLLFFVLDCWSALLWISVQLVCSNLLQCFLSHQAVKDNIPAEGALFCEAYFLIID